MLFLSWRVLMSSATWIVVIADICAFLSLIPDDATTSATIDEFLNEIGRHHSDAIRALDLSLEQSKALLRKATAFRGDSPSLKGRRPGFRHAARHP
jgi:hypothetical protein